MNLLFVCSGNICRSPMAERIAVQVGDELGLPIHARSASTLGLDGRPAHRHAVAVLREVGLDLRDHRSQPVSAELVDWADHVLVMEFTHAAHLREFFPSAGEKLLLLGTFGGMPEVSDPIGGWRFRFRTTRKLLDKAIRAFVRHVAR